MLLPLGLVVGLVALTAQTEAYAPRGTRLRIPPGWKGNATAAGLAPNIVGGVQVASATTFPWMALIETDEFMCGATLIAPNVAMTAAHCVVNTAASEWTVSTYRRNSQLYAEDENAIEYSVTRIIRHGSYNPTTNANDIALLILSAPTNYGTRTPRWIALNRNANFPAAGTTAKILGWGDTFSGSEAGSAILRQADIPVASRATCIDVLNGDGGHASMICAGSRGKDTCQGDSGGPLAVLSNGAWIQIGITSFGTKGCADPNEYLGVYARVSNLASWIDTYLAQYAPSVLPGKSVVKTTAKKTTTKKAAMCTTVAPCRSRNKMAKRNGSGAEQGQVTITVRETITVYQ